MNKKSIAYQVIAKTAAVMLVFSLLMPSALKAKQLVDFCMMEMSHHNTADDTHDCCVLDLSNLEGDQKSPDNCEGAQICACAVDTSLTNNQFKVPTAKSSDVILSRMGFNFMVNLAG